MKNYNIKAALFDLDGVVVFTDKYHYLAWKQLADEQGWEFDETVNNRLRGIPRLASLEEILKHNGVSLPMEQKLALMERKNRCYVELLQNINQEDLYPGAVDFIKKLRARGTKIALCSSSKNAHIVLEKLGITSLFDELVTGNDIRRAKPDPEIFLLGAQRLKMPIFHCVVFEDAKAGILGAKAAGMKTVGVGNREETEKLADQFIASYDEIQVDTFLESGAKQPLPVDEFKIIETDYNESDLNHIESLFALGNGYMGLRGTYDEYDEGIPACDGMYINGIFATKKYEHLANCVGFAKEDEFTVNLMDWRIINLYIDGEKACFSKENIRQHRRELDMQTGCICRSFIFETAAGKHAQVTSVRFVNNTDIHSGQISYCVKALDFTGRVVLESQAVKLTKIEEALHCSVVSQAYADGVYTCLQQVDTTGQQAAFSIIHEVLGADYTQETDLGENVFSCRVTADLKQGSTVTLQKYAAFYASVDGLADLQEASVQKARQNKALGFEALRQRQSAFWEAHWQTGDVVIQGNPADQQAVRFSLFQLKQQLVTANGCSIGATGLTGCSYSGKVFWDTEMYLMPYYNFTDPASQKELLMYRYRILDKARARAREFGTVGAMYAWCSIDGEETSVVFEASTAEYHLGADIAYAIWRYYDTTGDRAFVYRYGAEIVVETAKFLAHRGAFVPANGDKFCINAVCGPDEYACGVNNNMYTNFMVQFHLRFAQSLVAEMKLQAPEQYARLAEKTSLTEEEIALWKRAADNMYYKYNEELGIHEQDDSFVRNDPVDMEQIPKNLDIRWSYHPLDLWRMQVSKQADVVLLNFIQGDKFTYQEKLRNYDYYEPKCNHGSSLSTAIHAIMAAELGKPEAYEFFRCSAYMDISDFKHNTSGGLHMACLGGVWMTVVNGFLGMRHYTNGLLFDPHIPEAWEGYSLQLAYRGARMQIRVDHHKAEFTLISGQSLSFRTGETAVTLTQQEPVFVCGIW